MSIKKLLYYFAVGLLTLGASVILGFLSLTGMLALSPLLGLAIAAFVLSVVYEAEIYSQNIRSALNKIVRMDYLTQWVGRDLLKKSFSWEGDALAPNTPQFLQDYYQVIQNKDKQHKALRKKLLKDMENTFIRHLADPENPANEPQLQQWLKQKNLNTCFRQSLRKKRMMYGLSAAFAAITTVFMTIGTSYLLMESIGSISVFAFISAGSLPAIIIPLSIIAGIAYGLLAFNSITDMINNNTLVRWASKIKGYWFNAEGTLQISAKGIIFTVAALALAALAVTLTVLTAGTWWTVVQKTKPVIAWLSRLPEYVMGIINPIIVGLAQLSFNLSNTGETLELLETAAQKDLSPSNMMHKVLDALRETYHREGLLSFLNPFRLLYKLIYTPVRLLLFLGHLISIGVTSDRVPEMDEILAAVFGIISETFEDAHYFFGHSHQHAHSAKEKIESRLENAHGHHHGLDLPATLLRIILSPIKQLAKLWKVLFAKAEPAVKAKPAENVPKAISREENTLPFTRVKDFVRRKLATTSFPDDFKTELQASTSLQDVHTTLSKHRQSNISMFRKLEKYFPEPSNVTSSHSKAPR